MKKLTALLLLFMLPGITFGATFNRNLSYGMTGADVSDLQQFLTYQGVYNGPITVTFGPLTQKALVAFQQQAGISSTGYFGVLSRAKANTIVNDHPEWTVVPLSNNNYYTNSAGNQVHSPAYAPAIPVGASAQCGDGTYSFSQSRRGTCSHHGGVATWL